MLFLLGATVRNGHCFALPIELQPLSRSREPAIRHILGSHPRWDRSRGAVASAPKRLPSSLQTSNQFRNQTRTININNPAKIRLQDQTRSALNQDFRRMASPTMS